VAAVADTDEYDGSRPVPDPTLLTTEQLLREIGGLKDLVESWIDTLEQVNAEKLRSVWSQFEIVERQRVEQKADSKAAVDAALSAQKEAVKEQTTASERSIAKSEASTTKQLEQLSETFATNISSLSGLIGDNKERILALETLKVSASETRTDQRLNIGMVVGILGTVAAFASIAVAIAVALSR
jgi:hypothetical protein